jgi:hypothetical protein
VAGGKNRGRSGLVARTSLKFSAHSRTASHRDAKSPRKFFEKISKKPLTMMQLGSTNTLVSCKQSTLQTRHCGLKGGILDAR